MAVDLVWMVSFLYNKRNATFRRFQTMLKYQLQTLASVIIVFEIVENISHCNVHRHYLPKWNMWLCLWTEFYGTIDMPNLFIILGTMLKICSLPAEIFITFEIVKDTKSYKLNKQWCAILWRGFLSGYNIGLSNPFITFCDLLWPLVTLPTSQRNSLKVKQLSSAHTWLLNGIAQTQYSTPDLLFGSYLFQGW